MADALDSIFSGLFGGGADAASGALDAGGSGFADAAGSGIGDAAGGVLGGAGGTVVGDLASAFGSGGDVAGGVASAADPVAGGAAGAVSGLGTAAAPAAASAATLAPQLGLGADALPTDLTGSGGGALMTDVGAANPATPGGGGPDTGGAGWNPAATPGGGWANTDASTGFQDAGSGAAPNAMPEQQGMLGQAGEYAKDAAGALGLTSKNALPAALTAAGLGYSMMKPNSIPGQKTLGNQANALSAEGAQLQSYLQNGTLPPGIQTAVDQATKHAAQAIKSKYAQMGASGSTMEQQEINQLQLNATTQAATIATQLLGQGLTATGMSNQIYETLLRTNTAQSAQTGNAIASLAAALGGGGAQPRNTVNSGAIPND